MDEEKFIITPEEAESLLLDGPTVHNFAQSSFMLLGCDYGREEAIAAFKAAKLIEIAGPTCKAMKHPIAVHEQDGRWTVFEADMAKVEAIEASRASLNTGKG